jgi:hypothetical protein
MTNNVFKFPESRIVREVQPNIDEIERAKHKSLLNYSDMIVSDLIEGMLNSFDNYGIETDKEDFQKDLAFTVDALTAAVYRHFGIEHRLHKFIDEHVQVVPKGVLDMIETEEVPAEMLEDSDADEEELDKQ